MASWLVSLGKALIGALVPAIVDKVAEPTREAKRPLRPPPRREVHNPNHRRPNPPKPRHIHTQPRNGPLMPDDSD